MTELPVALLYPGQGSQHPSMATGLYDHEPAFTKAMDEVFTLLAPEGDAVRADWLSDEPVVPIDHAVRAQILLLAVNCAVTAQLRSWGVAPAAVLGHSAGELAAAVTAGVFALPDAVHVMWSRVRLAHLAPPGGMLAVAASTSEVDGYLSGDVVVGAINSPRQLILAGPADALARTARALRADGVTCLTVPATTGYHSPMLAPLAAACRPLFESVPMHPPRLPMFSGYTGARLTEDDVRDTDLWAGHLSRPVLFWPALDALLATGPYRIVEAGPGQVLSGTARRHPAVSRGASTVHAALPARRSTGQAQRDALRRLAEALAG